MGDGKERHLKILTFVRHYLPAYKSGGPVRTIANMVDHLGDNLNFQIVTMNRDAQDDFPFPGITSDSWTQRGNARLFYCSLNRVSIKSFAQIIRETPNDIIYLNSFFDPFFTLKPLLALRLCRENNSGLVIAPRGEFSSGAFALKKWKKLPYSFFIKIFKLLDNVVWQASSPREAKDIRTIMGRSAKNIVIAPNMPPLSRSCIKNNDTVRSGAGSLQVVFLSRIDVMKNLDFALQVLKTVTVPVTLNIYGPVWNETYWLKCQRLIAELPDNVKAKYFGPLPPESVGDVLGQHDLLFLPTRGENFGHVILESLTAGTPVLISDTTPWQDDGNDGCTVYPLHDLSAFKRGIEYYSQMNEESLLNARLAAKEMAHRFINIDHLVKQNLALFDMAMSYKS